MKNTSHEKSSIYSEKQNFPSNLNKNLTKNFESPILKNLHYLDRAGKIKYAKKHSSADRPLHKIRNFTRETDFCQCCNLPCETKGVIEPYRICDSTDKFSECGLGVSLYFHFFRYYTNKEFLVMTLILSHGNIYDNISGHQKNLISSM